MATFGYTTIGAQVDAPLLGPYVQMNKHTLTEGGNVSKISIYITATTTARNAKGLIHAADGTDGQPGTFKGATQGTACPTDESSGWLDLEFASPLYLAAGDYYLGAIADSTSDAPIFHYTWPKVGYCVTYEESYTEPGDLTIEEQDAEPNREHSIYATYEAGADPDAWTGIRVTRRIGV